MIGRMKVAPQTAIVAATEADLPAITAIYADAVLHGTATFEIEPPDEAEMRGRLRGLLDGGFPYLVSRRGDDLLGYAYAGPYRPRPAYRFTVEDSIYLAEEARGLGLGRLLLDRLIAESAKRGFRQMIAVIGDSGNVASVALHRAAGFAMIGTNPAVGFKFERWLDTVTMQRALSE
jgi:phosphinothricin acetyltransferase